MSTPETMKDCEERSAPPPSNTPVSYCGKMNISCFSEIRKTLANGKCIKSDAVAGADGGHSWRIAFYPNGKLYRTTDAISLYLVLDDDQEDGAPAAKYFHYHVNFRFKLYEVGGGPPRFTSANLAVTFSTRSVTACGIDRFATLEELEESGVLEQDRFTIGCEFTILSTTTFTRPVMRRTTPFALPDRIVAAPPPSATPEQSAVQVSSESF